MKRKSNWLKNLLQWGTLAAIVGFVVYGLTLGEKPADVEAYCPFGGLQALGSYLVNNSLACTMSMTQIMVGVMLAVGVILFSKLFCGYLCPLGTVSEWMGRGGKKLKVSVEIRPGSIADRLLRAVKYALLFYVFYMSASSSELFCKNFDPYYAVATGFKGEITVWMTVISVALLFLGSFFVKMFWCKYICPLSALSNIFKFTLTFAGIVILLWALGLLGVASAWVWALGAACVIGYLWEMIYLKSKVFPLLRIVRDEATCTKCDVCRRKCPYSIDIKNLDKVKHIDCTLCGTCVSACPEDSLHVITLTKKTADEIRAMSEVFTIQTQPFPIIYLISPRTINKRSRNRLRRIVILQDFSVSLLISVIHIQLRDYLCSLFKEMDGSAPHLLAASRVLI